MYLKKQFLTFILFFSICFNINAERDLNRFSEDVVKELGFLISQNEENDRNGKSHLNNYTLNLRVDESFMTMTCTDEYIIDEIYGDIPATWDILTQDLCVYNNENIFNIKHYGIAVFVTPDAKNNTLIDLINGFVATPDQAHIGKFVDSKTDGGYETEFKATYDVIESYINTHLSINNSVSDELMVTTLVIQAKLSEHNVWQNNISTKTVYATSDLMTSKFDGYIKYADKGTDFDTYGVEADHYYGDFYKRLAGYVSFFSSNFELPEGTSCNSFPSFQNVMAQQITSCYCNSPLSDDETNFLYMIASYMEENEFTSTSNINCLNPIQLPDHRLHVLFKYYKDNHGSQDWKSFILNYLLGSDENKTRTDFLLWYYGTTSIYRSTLEPSQRFNLLTKFQNSVLVHFTLDKGMAFISDIMNSALLFNSTDKVIFYDLLKSSEGQSFIQWLWDDNLNAGLGERSLKSSIVGVFAKLAYLDQSIPLNVEAYNDLYPEKTFTWKLNPWWANMVDHHSYTNSQLTGNQISFTHTYVESVTIPPASIAQYGSIFPSLPVVQPVLEISNHQFSPFELICVVPGEEFRWFTNCQNSLAGNDCKFNGRFMPAIAFAWYISNNSAGETIDTWAASIGVATALISMPAIAGGSVVSGAILLADVAATSATFGAGQFVVSQFSPNSEVINDLGESMNIIIEIAAGGLAFVEIGKSLVKASAYYRFKSLVNFEDYHNGFEQYLTRIKQLASVGGPDDIIKLANGIGVNGSIVPLIRNSNIILEHKYILLGWAKHNPNILNVSPAQFDLLVESLTNANIQRGLLSLSNTKFAAFIADIKPGGLSAANISANPLLIKGWNGLNHLPFSVRTNINNLELIIAPSTLGKPYISTLNGFSDDIVSLASNQGLGINDFKLLQQKRYDLSEMTALEMSKIDAIRNSIPLPDGNVILQKAIPKADIQKYLDGTYHQIGGHLTTAKDAKHLTTFNDIYAGMRLDYLPPRFNLSDGSCGVIRYKTSTPNAIVPKLPEVSEAAPYTGNGFTGGKNGKLGVPEWKTPYNTPTNGSELWEVFSDGTEVLKAKFLTDANKFIPIP